KAKRTLFEGLGGPPPELAVINADDPWSARLLDLPYPRRITYGLKPDAEVKVRHFAQSQAGLEATLAVPDGKLDVKSPLLGRANPLLIMNDALVGLQRAGRPYLAEADRETAIRKALEGAREGDVVVLAGKGHETYQVLKDRTIPFDDREVARRILRDIGFGQAGANEPETKSARR